VLLNYVEYCKEVKAIISGVSIEQERILQKYIDIYAKKDFEYDIRSFVLYSKNSDYAKASFVNIKKEDEMGFKFVNNLDADIDYLHSVFLSLYAEGDYDEAKIAAGNLYFLCRKKLGDDNNNTITALWYIRALIPTNDASGLALEIDTNIYNYCSHTYGNNSNPTINVILSIAMDLSDIEEYEDALELAKFAYERSVDKYCMISKETYETTFVRGVIYYNYGRIGLAKKFFEAAVDISENVYGEHSIETLKCMEKYSRTLKHRCFKRYQEALEIDVYICDAITKFYSHNVRWLVSSLDNVSMDYRMLDDINQALEKEYLALKIANDVLTIEDELTIIIYSNYSVLLTENGEYEDAYKADRIVYGWYHTHYGEFDYRTLKAEDALVIDNENMKKYDMAKTLAYNAYLKRKENLGEANPETLFSLQQYEDCLRRK